MKKVESEKEIKRLKDEVTKLKADIAKKDKIIEDLRVILEKFSKSSGIQY